VRSQSGSIRPLLFAPVLLAALACAQRDDEQSLRPVHVGSVGLDPRTSSPVVELVEDGDGGRGLRIWVGEFEAQSIERAIERQPVVRPNPHDLVKEVLERVEGRVRRSLVTELRNGTYYAVIVVDLHGRELRLDARPSDAIAVALRTGAPVLVSESLLAHEIEIPDDDSALDIELRGCDRETRDTPRL
jgi:hypothetical protein